MRRINLKLVVTLACAWTLFQLPLAIAQNTSAEPAEIINVQETRTRNEVQKPPNLTLVNKEALRDRPQGEGSRLASILAAKLPSAVPGSLDKIFLRGAETNIQYQINGVEMPELPTNALGQVFAVHNIESIQVTEGAMPAENGGRLSAVVDLMTAAPDVPLAQSSELSYGSYNSLSGAVAASAFSERKNVRYTVSAGYNSSDRGLGTPQPLGSDNQKRGGREAIHDKSFAEDALVGVDWASGGKDKCKFLFAQNQSMHQIPNYPESFKATDRFFQSNFVDQFGNSGGFNYTPADTDDTQVERNVFTSAAWSRVLSERAQLNIQSSWKLSSIAVNADPTHDLTAFTQVPNSHPTAFSEDRKTNSGAVRADYSLQLTDFHRFKSGAQTKFAQGTGPITITTVDPNNAAALTTSTDSALNTGWFEGAYVQDEWQSGEHLFFNLGIRYDSYQYRLGAASSQEGQLQPRLLLNYLVTATTTLHAFYGRLFQPAAVENLHDTFTAVGGGSLSPYDIKAEKDDYYELGVEQKIAGQVLTITAYDREATDLLDDAQLLNTSLSQPFNYARAFERGAELALKGRLSSHFEHSLNYAHSVGKGQGISGGLFAFAPGTAPDSGYRYLDHIQLDTAAYSLSHRLGANWQSAELLYGSGLPTGDGNSGFLPAHLTLNLAVGHNFQSAWLDAKLRASLDVMNVADEAYPISVANGFNGSYYSAGRTFIVHLAQEL